MRFLVLALCLAAAACGAPQTAPSETAHTAMLEIRDAWASATPGGVDVSAGYLTIANDTGADDRLITVASPRAASVEVHEMTMDGAVMLMRAVEGGLPIATGSEVSLAPGGMHLMFMGVTQPFAEGESIPVTLTFEHAGEMQVQLPVRAGAHNGR